MQKLGEIRVSGGRKMRIEIDGVIGLPEWWTFEGGEEERAATYERFRREVERIGGAEARKVEVRIRSIGGNVQDALLIYDALGELAARGAEITTICYGYTASAATVVAQAATTGRRLVSPTALYLIHNATTTLEGNAVDAERTAQLLDKTDERVARIYADRSGRPVEEFRERMARDGGRGEWLSPEEAVGAGLADAVGGGSVWGGLGGRVAERIRDWFGPSRDVVERAPVASGASVRSRNDSGRREVVEGAKVPELERRQEGALRSRVVRSTTLPCEDPSVVVAGLLEEDFTEFSRNGRAYQLDASRLRSGC